MKRGNEREGSGETIYPKFASSRSATGYTLICPLGNLSTPNAQPLLLASSWPSTSFPATPSTPIPTNPILPLSPTPFSRSAKPRSLTGILNTGDSSVFFSATLIPFPLVPPINIHGAPSFSFLFPLLSPSLPPSSPLLFPSVRLLFVSPFSFVLRASLLPSWSRYLTTSRRDTRALPMPTMPGKHSNLAQPFLPDT